MFQAAYKRYNHNKQKQLQLVPPCPRWWKKNSRQLIYPPPSTPPSFFTYSLSLYLHATFCIHVTQGCRARRGDSRAIFYLDESKNISISTLLSVRFMIHYLQSHQVEEWMTILEISNHHHFLISFSFLNLK